MAIETAPAPPLVPPEEVDLEATDGETEPVVDSPPQESEQTPEEQADAEARYEDAEILGKSYAVRRGVFAIGRNALRAKESTWAGIRNAFAKPGEKHGKVMHDIARTRYESKRAKYEASEGKSARLRARRERAMKKAETWMNNREAISKNRTKVMTDRSEAVTNNFETRKKEKIAYYKSKKHEAKARKALRHQLKTEGAGFIERRRITNEVVADIPKDHLMRIGELAVLAKLDDKSARKSERAEVKHNKTIDETKVRIENAKNRSKDYQEKVEEAEQTVEKMETIYLPKAKTRVKELQLELDDMGPNDPMRILQMEDLQDAKDRVDRLIKREIPYWKKLAQRSRENVAATDSLVEKATNQIPVDERRRDAANSSVKDLRTSEYQHRTKLAGSVTEALNTPENNER